MSLCPLQERGHDFLAASSIEHHSDLVIINALNRADTELGVRHTIANREWITGNHPLQIGALLLGRDPALLLSLCRRGGHQLCCSLQFVSKPSDHISLV